MAAAAALPFVRLSALGQQFYVWPTLPKQRERGRGEDGASSIDRIFPKKTEEPNPDRNLAHSAIAGHE